MRGPSLPLVRGAATAQARHLQARGAMATHLRRWARPGLHVLVPPGPLSGSRPLSIPSAGPLQCGGHQPQGWHLLSLVSTSSRAEKEPHEHGLGLLLCLQPRLTSPPLLALHLHALPSEAPMVWSQALSEGPAPAPCCLLHRPGIAASPMGLPCTRTREGQQPPRAVTSGISASLRGDTRDRQPGAWGRRCHGPRG